MDDARGAEVADINTVLDGLMPEMRRARLIGWGLAVGLVVFALFLLATVEPRNEPWTFQLIVIGIAGLLVFGLNAWVSRRQEALVMPALARSAGLDWRRNARDYVLGLPTRLLPRGSVRKCDDLVTGSIGGRRISFGEVKIETGGKNSSTLFQGIVAAFPNQVALPAFFLAAERETRGWFVFSGRIKVDDLRQLKTISGGSGESYGVWSGWSGTGPDHGLDDVLKVLTGLEWAIGSQAKLYSASSDGRTTHVALSHKRDLYNIGGLLASTEALMNDIRRAHADLSLPLTLVQHLLTAEQKVLASAPPAPGP
jgi:hypothetical protein